MPHPSLSKPTYPKLLLAIRREMERGVRRIEEVVEAEKLRCYWTIGQRMSTYLATGAVPLGGIGRFYDDLGRDLHVNPRTLQHYEQFFRYFPKFKPDPLLKWSHYRSLLVEPDAARRAAWIARIKKEKIPALQLRLALMPSSAGAKTPTLTEPPRGRLYTYRLLRAETIENFDVPWFVDLGFAARCEAPPSDAVLNNKYVYTSQKSGDTYRLKVVDATVDELFTFTGKLRRVVDGDTLLVLVDLGFSVWIEQRLRLKGIDAPELATLAGQKTKRWIEDALRHCPILVFKTTKSDQWDRYLVDVFYLPKETDLSRVAAEGTWLNGQMVEAGVAKLWTG